MFIIDYKFNAAIPNALHMAIYSYIPHKLDIINDISNNIEMGSYWLSKSIWHVLTAQEMTELQQNYM